MNYSQIKKLDKETLSKLTEGTGPSDQCLCDLLDSSDDEPKGIRASIKKAFASFGQKKRTARGGQKSIEIPISFIRGGGPAHATKEAVKRSSPCRKCSCDNEKFVLKHSYANIRITTPDLSTICPCPSDCLPDRAKLSEKIKVTVERATLHRPSKEVDNRDSECSLPGPAEPPAPPEPAMDRRPAAELVAELTDDEHDYN